MNDIQNKVIEWLKKGQDYQIGIGILMHLSKNKMMVNNLSQNHRPGKLRWELVKLSGLDEKYYHNSEPAKEKHKFVNPASRSKKNTIKNTETLKITEPLVGKKAPFNTLPLIVQEIIKQKGKLYREREVLHEKLKKVFNDNKPENKQKREQISTKIHHISKRIDQLYQLQEAYEKSKKLPSESVLVWNEEPAAVDKKQTRLMPDHSKMSGVDLRNRITNLRTYITRDENYLKYQSRKKEENENPMPDGPKKNQLIKKIDLRKSEISEIERILKLKKKKT